MSLSKISSKISSKVEPNIKPSIKPNIKPYDDDKFKDPNFKEDEYFKLKKNG